MKRDQAILVAMHHMIEGRSLEEIETFLRGQKVTRPVKVLDEARQRFRVVAEEEPGTRLGFLQAAVRSLFQRMIEVGDYPGALRALQELAKLSNAYQTAKESTPAEHGEDLDNLLQVIQGGGGRGK